MDSSAKRHRLSEIGRRVATFLSRHCRLGVLRCVRGPPRAVLEVLGDRHTGGAARAVDLLIRSLLALGTTPQDLGRMLSSVKSVKVPA